MHLLYLDESGSVADSSQQYFVLAGVAVFERATHWVEQDLNAIASKFAPHDPHSVELHGSPMRSGKQFWRTVDPAARTDAIKEALRVGISGPRTPCVVFASVIKKSALLPGLDPVEIAFGDLSSRFDAYLRRLYAKLNRPERGIILFDKASTETRIQTLAREFKYGQNSSTSTKNYAEVPVFLDSRASRLIQLADLVAFSVYRHFEHNDSQYYEVFKTYFDTEGGINHGLRVFE